MSMHHPLLSALIGVLWLAWLAYWALAARDSKPERRRETFGSRLSYTLPLIAGGILLASHGDPRHVLFQHFLPIEDRAIGYWLGVLLVASGLWFSVWARRYLGGNWSAAVAIKEGHELIRTGPYRWVRHPIYTGLLVALVGTCLAGARWASLLALLFLIGGLVRKLTLEERWLAENFPDYADYRSRVHALFPGIF